MIEKPSDIIYHIIGEELEKGSVVIDLTPDVDNNTGLDRARANHPDWKMAFTVNKKINSKKLIEGIAKESKLFPFFKGDKLSFNSLKDTYGSDDEDFQIKDSDVISYKFDRTKIDDIKTKVILNYHYDYARDEFIKSTLSNTEDDTASEFFVDYSNDYYGIEGEQGDDPIEVKYIRHDFSLDTADGSQDYLQTISKLQRFLLTWYCNQHNLCSVRLPLFYLFAEVGDVVAFPTLLGNNRKAYGEDYSLNYFEAVIRNGQQIFPYWMVMGVSKTLEYVELDLIQLHNSTTTLSGVPIPPEPEIPVANFVFQLELNNGGDTITSVQEGQTVYLNPHHYTANSHDPEGGELSYLWTENHTDIDLGNYAAMNPSFVAPPIAEGESLIYKIQLKVTAGGIDSNVVEKEILIGDYSEITINYNAGWNLIGLPFNVADADHHILFPNIVPDGIYYFSVVAPSVGWQPMFDPLMYHGVGYMARFSGSGSAVITGTALENLTITLIEGWNLISGIGYPVQVEDIIDPDAIIVQGGIFSFDDNYSPVDVIEPGKGYWIRAIADGEITLSV